MSEYIFDAALAVFIGNVLTMWFYFLLVFLVAAIKSFRRTKNSGGFVILKLENNLGTPTGETIQ